MAAIELRKYFIFLIFILDQIVGFYINNLVCKALKRVCVQEQINE